MVSELFSSLAAPTFAAMLFIIIFLLKRRSREINAAANDGTAGGASSSHPPTEVEGVATSSGYDYEVFLSFRGEDTRAGFTDFLYTSLKNARIRTFKDDEELRVGEEFAPELLQAIKQSKISIPIFSEGYASSVWCLKELVQMVECQKTMGQKIMPIFYDVEPSEVRYQTGGYGTAFRSHEKKKRYDKKTIREWRDALKEVSFLNGWDLHSKTDRREGEFAKAVTAEVFNDLKKAYLQVSDCLVSVDHHVDEIMQMIGAQTSETRIIGIHGMGGVGKSTIAKIIYNQLSNNFEDCCFLSDIREMSERNGIAWLQHQLISGILKSKWIDIKNTDEGTQAIKDRLSTKKVLLLLDDVDHKKQMDALLGNRSWFGRGSKLIITTRNKEVLKVPQVDDCYEVNCMDSIRSLQLFSKHAFRRDSPLDEYIDQSNRAIGIAGGLPLALEIIGSLLSDTEKENWGEKLDELANCPPEDVESKLKISYGALRDREKHVFLDIACLFVGYHKDVVIHFWESKFSPKGAMEVLENKSLIKIKKNNEVWMHDLLKDLGRAIVCEKSDMKLEKQSRVWDPKEGLDLLRRHKGNKEVEALRLKLDDQQRQYRFTYEGFESLSHLRFLEVDGWMRDFAVQERLLWHESPSNVFEENSNLLPQLRWLSWHEFPPTFNIANFSLEDMVFLDLSFSRITHDWKGWSHMKAMKNLKVLKLSYCYYLERTPHFSAHTNLERLILNNCRRLVEIDGSICQLKRLVFLNLHGCEELQRLPDEVGNLESLIELDIAETKIEDLPISIGNLKNLKILEMRDTSIRKIPNVLWTIEKLKEIEVTNFYRDPVNIDNCIYRNQSLKNLKLENFEIYAVPKLPESLVTLYLHWLHTFPDLSNLTNLKELNLEFCSRDYDDESDWILGDPLPRWMGNLRKQETLRLTSPYVTTTLPPHLKELCLYACHNLRRLRLPSSLSSIRLDRCHSLRSMGDLSNLKNLSSLHISFTAIEEIEGLGCLENLRDLQLQDLGQVKILPDLSNLSKLRSLRVQCCDNLVEIQGELPRFLDKLHIFSCHSLQNLPDLSCLMGKQQVQIEHCSKLKAKAILGFARLNQRYLRLSGFGQLRILPDLSNSSELRSLEVRGCRNLVEIEGLPESLQELEIDSCESLQKLPDLSCLMGKQQVQIGHCSKLKAKAILGFAWLNQRYLWLSGFGQLQILPDLRNSSELRSLKVRHCPNLVEIEGLPESLQELEIDSCESLQKLPDLSSLMGQGKARVNGCPKLNLGEDDEHGYESEGEVDVYEYESEGEDRG